MTDRSFSDAGLFHGDSETWDARTTEARMTGRPQLQVRSESAYWHLAPVGELTDNHASFARGFATAAADYAERVEFLAGAPAGAEFWASIDTCPDSCGTDCRGPH
jgi:hypothetical protein